MNIKRMLFIPEILWVCRCLTSFLIFFRMWVTSRNFVRLILAAPAIVLTIAFAGALVTSELRNHDPSVLNNYLELARKAAVAGNVQDVRILFRRAQQLAPGNRDLTMEFASVLFQLGERPEAYQLLSLLAPTDKSGHLPAHRFLVLNPPELKPVQLDSFRAIHLSHLVRNSAETREERVLLLQILARYRRFDDVEKLIHAAVDRYPEDRLFLAQLKFREGDESSARRETEEACRALRSILEREPNSVDRRIQLAQGHVFLTQFADAICVIAEGIAVADSHEANSISASPGEPNSSSELDVGHRSQKTSQPDDDRYPKLVSALGSTYFAWMETLPASEREIQRRCLHSMLMKDGLAISAIDSDAAISEKLQTAMLTPETSWVRFVMEGNARAARGELSEAEIAYRRALQSSPNDATLSNNLAWVLLKKSQTKQSELTESRRQELLTESLRWSEQAVRLMPEIVSFLETRGQVQAALGNYALALSDLNTCRSRGKDSLEIQRTLEACTQALR